MIVRKSVRTVFTIAVLAAALAAVSIASPAAAVGGRPLSAALLGSNEVPPVSTGDPDGSGSARVTLNQGQGVVCFDIAVQNIGTITLGHIHRGVAGTNGPVVVDFNPVVNGLRNCVSGVDASLIKDIRQNPEGYYVNIHTTEFRGGAVRGQLTK